MAFLILRVWCARTTSSQPRSQSGAAQDVTQPRRKSGRDGEEGLNAAAFSIASTLQL